MSKYQPRIIVHNPEIKVPDKINSQLFAVVQDGDLQKLQDFVLETKSRLTQTEFKTKNTVIHKVLMLPDNIANNKQKLELLKFLSNNMSTLDSPNANSNWPIHLASTLGDEDIIEFFVGKRVSLDVADSSGNTPLHNAIYGSSIPCPIESKIGQLGEFKDHSKQMPDIYKTLNRYLINLLNTDPKINKKIINAINTIDQMNLIYKDTDIERKIKNDMINILIGENIQNQINGIDIKKKFEELIASNESVITREFKKSTSTMIIQPGNTGWGYSEQENQITNQKRILTKTTTELKKNISDEYEKNKDSLINDLKKNIDITKEINDINTYVQNLLGENVSGDCNGNFFSDKLKLFVFIKYCLNNYAQLLTHKIMNNVRLTSKDLFDHYINRVEIYQQGGYVQKEIGGQYLLNSLLSNVIKNIPNKNQIDILIAEYLENDKILNEMNILDLNNYFNKSILKISAKGRNLTKIKNFTENFKETLKHPLYGSLVSTTPQSTIIKVQETTFVQLYSKNIDLYKKKIKRNIAVQSLFNRNVDNTKFIDAVLIFHYICKLGSTTNIDETAYPEILNTELLHLEEGVNLLYSDVIIENTTTTYKSKHSEVIFMFKYLLITLTDIIKKKLNRLFESISIRINNDQIYKSIYGDYDSDSSTNSEYESNDDDDFPQDPKNVDLNKTPLPLTNTNNKASQKKSPLLPINRTTIVTPPLPRLNEQPKTLISPLSYNPIEMTSLSQPNKSTKQTLLSLQLDDSTSKKQLYQRPINKSSLTDTKQLNQTKSNQNDVEISNCTREIQEIIRLMLRLPVNSKDELKSYEDLEDDVTSLITNRSKQLKLDDLNKDKKILNDFIVDNDPDILNDELLQVRVSQILDCTYDLIEKSRKSVLNKQSHYKKEEALKFTDMSMDSPQKNNNFNEKPRITSSDTYHKFQTENVPRIKGLLPKPDIGRKELVQTPLQKTDIPSKLVNEESSTPLQQSSLTSEKNYTKPGNVLSQLSSELILLQQREDNIAKELANQNSLHKKELYTNKKENLIEQQEQIIKDLENRPVPKITDYLRYEYRRITLIVKYDETFKNENNKKGFILNEMYRTNSYAYEMINDDEIKKKIYNNNRWIEKKLKNLNMPLYSNSVEFKQIVESLKKNVNKDEENIQNNKHMLNKKRIIEAKVYINYILNCSTNDIYINTNFTDEFHKIINKIYSTADNFSLTNYRMFVGFSNINFVFNFEFEILSKKYNKIINNSFNIEQVLEYIYDVEQKKTKILNDISLLDAEIEQLIKQQLNSFVFNLINNILNDRKYTIINQLDKFMKNIDELVNNYISTNESIPEEYMLLNAEYLIKEYSHIIDNITSIDSTRSNNYNKRIKKQVKYDKEAEILDEKKSAILVKEKKELEKRKKEIEEKILKEYNKAAEILKTSKTSQNGQYKASSEAFYTLLDYKKQVNLLEIEKNKLIEKNQSIDEIDTKINNIKRQYNKVHLEFKIKRLTEDSNLIKKYIDVPDLVGVTIPIRKISVKDLENKIEGLEKDKKQVENNIKEIEITLSLLESKSNETEFVAQEKLLKSYKNNLKDLAYNLNTKNLELKIIVTDNDINKETDKQEKLKLQIKKCNFEFELKKLEINYKIDLIISNDKKLEINNSVLKINRNKDDALNKLHEKLNLETNKYQQKINNLDKLIDIINKIKEKKSKNQDYSELKNEKNKLRIEIQTGGDKKSAKMLKKMFNKLTQITFGSMYNITSPLQVSDSINKNKTYTQNKNIKVEIDFEIEPNILMLSNEINNLFTEQNIDLFLDNHLSKIEIDVVVLQSCELLSKLSKVKIENKNMFEDFCKDINFSRQLINPHSGLLDLLKAQGITNEVYMIEMMYYIFVNSSNVLYSINMLFDKINIILNDVLHSITKRFHYFIPQIYLPTICYYLSQIIKSQKKITNVINNSINQIIINVNSVEIQNLDKLLQQFKKYINNILLIKLGKKIQNIIDIYDSIIHHLNYTSAYELITRENNLFDQLFYKLDRNNLNTGKLDYFTTFYYNVNRDISFDKINFDHFKFIENGKQKIFYKYLDIKLKSNRDDPKSQINLVFIDNMYIIDETKSQIGPWFTDNTQHPQFDTANIGFKSQKYNTTANGMPYFIKPLIDEYLTIVKQEIVEETITDIFTNTNSDSQTILNFLKKYTNDQTSINLSNELNQVKISAIIATYVDIIINHILKYAIKLSISNWIESIATETYKTMLHDSTYVKPNTLIIPYNEFKNNLHLIFNDINRPDIDYLSNNKNLEQITPQIELNPDSLMFTSINSAKQSPNFIHYIYDAPYFSSNEAKNIKQCRNINVNIVSKLITASNVNKRNNQGMTPLHYAVIVKHPTIVKILLGENTTKSSYIANPHIKNMYSKTPLEIAYENLKLHLDYNNGSTVIESLNKITTPINDSLISKLKEDRFKNNIIKNISYTVPICLVMYNHTWTSYLHNYRYNISYGQKIKLIKIVQKYCGIDINEIYPYDLFKINTNDELEQILKNSDNKNNINNIINSVNKNKIDRLNYVVELLQNQIKGAEIERTNTNDNAKINFIDLLIKNLKEKMKDSIEKLEKLSATINPVNTSLLSLYQNSYESMINKMTDRTTGITEFYVDGFSQFTSKTNNNSDLIAGIWNNYLTKNINNTKSMIFTYIHIAIGKIINLGQKNMLNNENIEDLNTITSFMENVTKYVELKKSLNQDLSNPPLKCDFDHMLYLFKTFVFPKFENMFINITLKWFTNNNLLSLVTDKTNNHTKEVDNLIEIIKNLKYNNKTIHDFFEDYAEKSLSYYSKIFDENNNSYSNIKSDDDLFIPLFNIVKSNNIFVIDDESQFLIDLKKDFIPFIVNTIDSLQTTLRLTIYSYDKYLLNTYQLLAINSSLLQFNILKSKPQQVNRVNLEPDSFTFDLPNITS